MLRVTLRIHLQITLLCMLYMLLSLSQARSYSPKVFRGFVIGSFTPDSSYWSSPTSGNQQFTIPTSVPIQNYYGATVGLQEIQYLFADPPAIALSFYCTYSSGNFIIILYDSLSSRTVSLRLRYLIIDADFDQIGGAVCWIQIPVTTIGTYGIGYYLTCIPGYTLGHLVVPIPLIYRIDLAYLALDPYLFSFSFSYTIVDSIIYFYVACSGNSNLVLHSLVYRILLIDISYLQTQNVVVTTYFDYYSNDALINIPAPSSSVMFGLSSLTFTGSTSLKLDSTLVDSGIGQSNIMVTLDPNTALLSNVYLYAVATSCPSNFPFEINSTTCTDACLESQYTTSLNSRICRSCNPICLTCFDTALRCTSCNLTANRIINGTSCSPMTGYYQSSVALPLPCSPNCISCLDSTICYECVHNHTLDVNGVCTPCSISIPHCLTCHNTTLCDQCMPGFNLRSYMANKTQCIPVCSVSNCVHCLSSAICLQCRTYFVLQGGQCVSTCGDGVLILAYEQCDDGNLLNHDGCDSQCHNQTNWSCVVFNSFTFLYTGRCEYTGSVILSLLSIKKSTTSNTFLLLLQYNSMEMSFWKSINLPDILKFSSNGTPFASNISSLASDGSFTAQCTYSQDMYGSTLTITTDFTSGSPTVANIPNHTLNIPIFSVSNQLTHLYSTQYSQAATLSLAFIVLSCISIVVLLITFISNAGKIHGVQALMWSQFTYSAYIGTQSTSPLIDGMNGLSYSNIYNLRGTDVLFQNSGTSAIFLENYNIGLGVMLLPIFIGLVFKLIEKIRAKSSPPIEKTMVDGDLDSGILFPKTTVSIGDLLLNQYVFLCLMCCIYPVYCFGVISIVQYEAMDGVLIMVLFTILLGFYLYRYTITPQDFTKDLYRDSLCAKYYLLFIVLNVVNAALLPLTTYQTMVIFLLILILLLKSKPFKALKDTGKCISEMVLLMLIGGSMAYVRAGDVEHESTLRMYLPLTILGLLLIVSGINWVFAGRCIYKKLSGSKKQVDTNIDVKGFFKNNLERQGLFNQPPLGKHVQKYQQQADKSEIKQMKQEEWNEMKEMKEMKMEEQVVKEEQVLPVVKRYVRKRLDLEFDDIDQL